MDKKQRFLMMLIYKIERYEKEAGYAQAQIDFLTPSVKDHASGEVNYNSGGIKNLGYWREVRDDALYELEGYEYILNNFKKNKIKFN